MDIKARVEEIVQKLKADPAALAGFQKDPAGTIKTLTGLDIPAEQLDQVVGMVKAKLDMDKLSGAAGALGGLFGKK